jgi:iron complex transport system ATP-binding protein
VADLDVRLGRVMLGEREVLGELAFRCEPGQCVGILGPNGAGKTTLLRSIVSLVPYQGAVRVGGEVVGQLAPNQRARLLAYVPQRSLLDAPLSVRDVVMQGRYCHQDLLGRVTRSDRSAVDAALGAMDVAGLERRRFTELSGGEQRRVLLARALATEASVILLDEPTAALDIGHALRLFGLLRQLADSGKVVVVVLHQIADAERFCDRVCVLHQGRLRSFQSPPLEPSLLREVYGVEVSAAHGRTFTLPRNGEP